METKASAGEGLHTGASGYKGSERGGLNKLSELRYRNSLAVQWLGLGAFSAKGPGSIPGRGTKIPQAVQRSQKQKKELGCRVSQ